MQARPQCAEKRLTPSDPPSQPSEADPRDALFDTSKITKNLGQRTGRASIVVLMVSMLRVVLQIASISVLGRLIPPEEFGVFALAVPGVMLALALSSFGLPQAVIQRKAITHQEVSSLFWMSFLFAAIATIVVASLSHPAAVYFKEPRLEPVFVIVSLSILLSVMVSQYQAIMRRSLRVRIAEYVTLTAEVLAVAIAILAALGGLSYWALVLQQICTPLIALIGMFIVTRWLPSSPLAARFREVFDALSFGGFIAGFSIMNRLTEYAGTFITGANFDSAAAGLFYRSRTLASIPSRKIMVPLSGAFIPAFSRLQDDILALNTMYERLMSRSNLLVLPIAVLMATAADPLTLMLLGREWAEMAPLMFWTSLFVLRLSLNSGLQYILIATGQGRDLFFYAVFRFIAVVIGMLIAARHGIITMTATYMLIELFITLPLMAVMALRRGVLSMEILWRTGLQGMLVAVAITAVLKLTLMPAIAGLGPVVQVLIAGAVIGILYGIQILINPGMRRDILTVLQRMPGARFLIRLGSRPKA